MKLLAKYFELIDAIVNAVFFFFFLKLTGKDVQSNVYKTMNPLLTLTAGSTKMLNIFDYGSLDRLTFIGSYKWFTVIVKTL